MALGEFPGEEVGCRPRWEYGWGRRRCYLEAVEGVKEELRGQTA